MAAEVAYVGSEAEEAIFRQVKTVSMVHLWKSSESSDVVARRMSVCLVVTNYGLACQINCGHVSVTSCGPYEGTCSILSITWIFVSCVEKGSDHADCCARADLLTHFFCHVSTPNCDLSCEVKCYHRAHGGHYVDVVTKFYQGDYVQVKGSFHDEAFDQGCDFVFCSLVMDDPQMVEVEVKGFWVLFEWLVPHC